MVNFIDYLATVNTAKLGKNNMLYNESLEVDPDSVDVGMLLKKPSVRWLKS